MPIQVLRTGSKWAVRRTGAGRSLLKLRLKATAEAIALALATEERDVVFVYGENGRVDRRVEPR